jgi:hypothetical protein
MKSGGPLPCPKSFDSHRLLDNFCTRSFAHRTLARFLGAVVSLCWMTLVVFFHTFSGFPHIKRRSRRQPVTPIFFIASPAGGYMMTPLMRLHRVPKSLG